MASTVDQEQSARMALTSFYSIIPVSFAVIGMQIFMCCYGFIVYKETPQSIRKGRRVYIICSWIILFFFSISQAADAVEIFLLLANSTSLLEAATVLRPKLEFSWWRIVSSAGLWFANWVGDGMLVWRCYHVWHEHRWVAIIPGSIFIGSCIASTIALTYRALWLADPSRGPQLYGQALQAWIFLSTAVNIIVTGLISIRLLGIRKQLSTVLSPQDLQIYLGIIAILVESALPLSLAGIAFAAVSTPSSSGAKTVARTTVLLCWFSLNALSPQMIIFRVLTGRSWVTNPTSDVPSMTTKVQMSTAMQFTNPIGARTNRDEEEEEVGEGERGDGTKEGRREQGVQSRHDNSEDRIRRRCTCGHDP
ncbi:hypothetical protein BKA70DRAFT_129217 [Coprinopsis sp. MPI-PUGE-AT-0042]|nr:hypothetical protein BKA70DRAFT_129217 [Coprinopsis sp. MPI-PUGE-AT-0042]